MRHKDTWGYMQGNEQHPDQQPPQAIDCPTILAILPHEPPIASGCPSRKRILNRQANCSGDYQRKIAGYFSYENTSQYELP